MPPHGPLAPPDGLVSGSVFPVCGTGGRGSIDWEEVDEVIEEVESEDGEKEFEKDFDAFVNGGAHEAEEFFANKGKPVHCLSTRFEGVNYRVSMLIGFASYASKDYMATYNPNFFNQFTTKREGESEADAKSRTNGRWLLSFCKALERTERTGGYLVQVAAHWHSNLRGPDCG